MSTEQEQLNFARWMPAEVVRATYSLEDRLLEAWTDYVRTIGPSVVSAYRTSKLKEQPHIYVFNRVQEKMQQIAWNMLWEEEMKQDKEDGA